VNDLGEAIRKKRTQLALSLSDVATRSGVSAAMLSEVERGKKSPTIRVLSHIAEALGCSISDLLGEPSRVSPRVTLAKDRKRIVDPESGIERVSLSEALLARGIDTLLYRLPAGADTGPFAPHRSGVVETLVVVRGAVEVHVGDDVFQLAVDDSLTYGADAMHRYRNRGRSAAELFLIIDSSQAAKPGG
jgi:transcriptional regulator with XRE-family HTH domain